MGQHHARVYRELPGVDLVGVYDVDHDQAMAVAEEHGTKPLSLDGLVETADVVSIVVPTAFHKEMAERAIESGTDILIEKPLAPTSEAAREIVDAADEADVTLQVGHIERFNPAVQAVSEFADELDPIALEAQRQGPPVDRDGDDDVVMDLMVHDIDVACALLDGEVTAIEATGTAGGDYVTASLTFDDHVVATMTASRVTAKKLRNMAVTADDCRVDVDYTSQDVTITRRTEPEYVAADDGLRFRSETLVEQPTVNNGEPLKEELSSFVESVREDTEPEVTGEDGRRVIELAERVRRELDNELVH
ncbi:Gfo/Idh/MocA family oxidoreductase [Natronomonas salina]|uniref:Gfo/Idh/MocA family protein n=1 Tax=Natronomonas salina TaxID=1710540 RepID=UPI0015B47654|nr:Gfo/Idh/MocA family oxidoreductase [Natronomonas salina]